MRSSPFRRHANEESEMSKIVETPTSRLICFGSAKAHTNAAGGQNAPEEDISVRYN